MSTLHLIAVEFFKLRKRMMTWILALVLVGLVILLYSVLWSVSGRATTFGENAQFTGQELRRALFLETSVPFSLQVVATFGTLLAVVLAAGAAGGEYSWGTIRLMMTATSGRLRFLTAQLVVVVALIAAGIVLAVAVGLAYSTVITYASGGADFDFVTGEFIREQLLSYLRTLFVMMPYVALAFAAAVIGRSTLAGVGAGLGVAFLEPLVSGLMRLGGDPWERIPNLLINANRQVILIQNQVPEVATFGPTARQLERQDANSVEVASLILVVYVVIFLVFALALFRRRDVVASGGG